MNRLQFFATTVMGLEDIAAKEIENLIGAKPFQDVGRVIFDGKVSDIYLLNLKARTINKFFIQLCYSRFEKLDDIYKLSKRLDYEWIINSDQTFAVRTQRIGVHDFTSMDVSRVVGQAIIDSYMAATGRRLKVNLDNPDIEIYCLVRDNEFLIGVNTTGPSLHKRYYRIYNHPAALKPTIASAMLKIGGWPSTNSLIDPMCGGATIPIEAALESSNIPPGKCRNDFSFLKLKICSREEFENLRSEMLLGELKQSEKSFSIYAMEKFAKHIQGGIENAKKAEVYERICFQKGDATCAEDYPNVDFDLIVVNPPYGLRTSLKEGASKLYELFLHAIRVRFPGATLVLITAASKRFKEAAEKAGLTVMNERKVWHGELLTSIFTCKV